MVFSHQTRGVIAQILTAISTGGAETFLYKHLGVANVPSFVGALANASDDALRAMATELIVNNKLIRAAAPIKHVFESGVEDLERWVLHDGWIVEEGGLVRVTPAAEETTGIRDKLIEDLASSGLDSDGSIRKVVEDSSKDFNVQSPDFNGSITKVRITLESIARRAAQKLAAKQDRIYRQDSWGKALQLLRSLGAIEQDEEEILARIYTFISPGAHVPKGVTQEEWARLARTFGLSSAYFLLHKYMAA